MSQSDPPTKSTDANSASDSNKIKSGSLTIPFSTKMNRTNSIMTRAFDRPKQTGTVKSFCREKGHGYITPNVSGEEIFVHISDFEGEYVPLPGDEVEYRLCPIPPKLEKNQAVQVRIIHLNPEVHLRWSG